MSSLPEVGQSLHARYAEDGNFYAGNVIAVSKRRGKAPVKVEFKGWEGDATWFSMDDLKCKALGLTGKAKAEEPAPKKGAKADKPKAAAAAEKAAAAPEAGKKGGKKIVVKEAELPSLGEQVNVKASSGGKMVAARVVAASLQVQYADGSTAWVDSTDIAPQFKCTACSQTFTTELGRDNHWWDRHIVTCKECGKIFDNEKQRDEHWWDTHIEYCKQCGKICEDIGALVAHTREVHAVKCKQCGKECSSIRMLVEHARDKHQYAQNLVDPVHEAKKESKGVPEKKAEAKPSSGKKSGKKK